MLTKITVLNSHGYGRAQIRLDDCESMQLVGPNNIGKSTLIYTLNFLFIVDGPKMTFSGNRKGDKDTIHHYFPSPTQSFIIFEIKKNAYYCILLKRDIEGDLEYYRINSEYKDEFFYEVDNTGKKLLPFEKVREKLVLAGVHFSPYKNKTEVFNEVYQRGRKNNGVVWLEDSVKTDGLSNNFSKVYRYLINSKLIDNKALKDALIIADNRENDSVNFSHKNKKDINDLLRINDELKNIKTVQKDFTVFREAVNLYKAKTSLVGQWLYVFRQQFSPLVIEMDTRSLQKKNEIETTKIELNEDLKPKLKTLFTKTGEIAGQLTGELNRKEFKQKEIAKIKAFEPIIFLNEALDNLNRERKQIEGRLTTIESQQLSTTGIESKTQQISLSIQKLEIQIANYNNLLVHKISGNMEHKKLVNSILSQQVLNLPSKHIIRPVDQVADILRLFDGEISIKGLELAEIDSVEALELRLVELKKDLAHFEALLPVAKNYEEFNRQLLEINNKIKETELKIAGWKSLENLEIEFTELTADIEKIEQSKTAVEKDTRVLEEQISRKEDSLLALSEDKQRIDLRCRELRNQKAELEDILVPEIEFQSNDSLDSVYKRVKSYDSDRTTIKNNKERLFDNLKNKLNSAIADEDVFISFVEEEIACLSNKENSIESLLKSIATQFSNPAFNLLRRYEDFKQFINNKINNKLSKTKISDIESLKIIINDSKRVINDLNKISEIQDFSGQLFSEFKQTDNLTLLNNYLDAGKRIAFEDLFDIELHLTVKGKEKTVDLAKQVESDGTDRMIRLIIIMSIIHRMVVKSEENRITIFIDEIATIDEQNRPELVRFCKEHLFIPIFAAPGPYSDFNKYYFIYPSSGKINITEESNVMWRERN
ncbi:MAG: hypothetical protein ABI581_00255 [Sediminibacterium sp.]